MFHFYRAAFASRSTVVPKIRLGVVLASISTRG
jgi:hypothetical protein